RRRLRARALPGRRHAPGTRAQFGPLRSLLGPGVVDGAGSDRPAGGAAVPLSAGAGGDVRGGRPRARSRVVDVPTPRALAAGGQSLPTPGRARARAVLARSPPARRGLPDLDRVPSDPGRGAMGARASRGHAPPLLVLPDLPSDPERDAGAPGESRRL